ncbi:hypothetical protein [Acetivibrio mesophilus]|uniref:DUF3999 domain-containing protein n=1 Tax=Acetivibrio mesophilus TaxID=2487273 RepID=A0A4Q0I5Z7_9FIRM|nr:hypothetical protein [Acetivibrio mesophilus]ODM25231.1 hypothetical protein A7W90_02775 [Clostridium sp. Bc-iso-3]RXE59751.1 hypothetical protein EFD62_05395 [Acetivibrio mesophilus]HHV29328.1 hypothetical protein [Clostridium sp.]
MIKKALISTVLFALLFSSTVYALDFSYSARIENMGSQKYKAVRITPKIYNNISANMADLALYDENNEPIPYFLNSFTESEVETKRSYAMKLINSFVKDEYYYYDYTLERLPDGDVTATSLEIKTDRNGFAKKVEILGSYDNINWEKVQDDILYSVDGIEKLEINFDSVKKYTHYRFKIPNNLEKISFSSVELKYNMVSYEKEYFSETIIPEYSVVEQENETVIKINNFKNLKLSSITLKTDSTFKRKVTFDGRASKTLYNLNFNDTQYTDLTLPIEPYRVASDTAEIVIENKDDKPINIQGIEAKYLFDELVFEGSGAKEYTLKFGNSEISTPKSYDISSYSEYILDEGYDVLNIKEIKEEPHQVPDNTPEYNYKLIFNIVISAVAVIMAVIIFLKIKK